MNVVIVGICVWFLLAGGLGLLVGKVIRSADEREGIGRDD